MSGYEHDRTHCEKCAHTEPGIDGVYQMAAREVADAKYLRSAMLQGMGLLPQWFCDITSGHGRMLCAATNKELMGKRFPKIGKRSLARLIDILESHGLDHAAVRPNGSAPANRYKLAVMRIVAIIEAGGRVDQIEGVARAALDGSEPGRNE